MSDEYYKSFEEFLDPDVLRPRLVAISVYIAAFEMLKTSIIERLRSFLTVGGDDGSYQTEVSVDFRLHFK